MSPAEVRDLLNRVRDLTAEVGRLRGRAEAIGSMGSHPEAGRGGGPSDPTARVAVALADLDAEIGEREAELARASEWCESICDGLREALGGLAADVVADYYLRCLPWERVAALNNVSASTAIRARDTAIEWVAEVGPHRAMEGTGNAES